MNYQEKDAKKTDSKGELENPFTGYLANLQKHKSAVNPVHEIVNCYYKMNGWEKMPIISSPRKQKCYTKLVMKS